MRLYISSCNMHSVCRWFTVTLCTSHYFRSRFQEFSFTRSLLQSQKYANGSFLVCWLSLLFTHLLACSRRSACICQQTPNAQPNSRCVSRNMESYWDCIVGGACLAKKSYRAWLALYCYYLYSDY